MPSFISSFSASKAIAVLLAGLALLGALAEISASVGLARISKIQRRIDTEGAEALRIPRESAGAKPTLLLVGNSLALEGIDFPELQKLVAGKYDAHRFIVEQTHYLDWYFGLKRVFHKGARPAEVVLSLSVGQLLADTTRGEFAARYMMDVRDVPEAAHRERLDATTTSNLVLAHYSGWLGTRAEIRKWLLGRVLPDSAELANVLGFRPAPVFSPSLIRAVAPLRFRELRALCESYGAKFSFLVPPVPESEDGSTLLGRIGEETGVPVLVPVKPAEFPRNLFLDGFHLNAKGANRFTPLLAAALLHQPQTTGTPSPQYSRSPNP